MKKVLALLALLMLSLSALAYWISAPKTDSPLSSFTFASVEYGPLADTVSATGTLHPQEVIPVGTDLGGKVVEVAADFNQTVEEGDLLFRLDDRAAEQRLRQAEVAVELARAEVERAKAQREAAQKSVDRLRSLSQDVSLRKDLDAAEAQLRAASVAVDVAEVRVKEAEQARSLADLGVKLTRIHVPTVARASSIGEGSNAVGAVTSGGDTRQPRRKFIVLDRKVELNQQVGPPSSAQLFTLAGDLAQMQVHAQVAEGDIGRVRRGQKVEFTVATYADDVRFTGRVVDIRLLPTSDHGAIFYKVVVEVANVRDPATGEWQLRPGMTTSTDVVVRMRERTWKVPLTALNVEMPSVYLTEAARARLARWQASPDRHAWKPVWVLGDDGKPSPLLVRLGVNPLRDAQFSEVSGWDPEMKTPPDPTDPTTYPQLIIAVPPVDDGGLFKLPKIKI